jgi:hypothetical protein
MPIGLLLLQLYVLMYSTIMSVRRQSLPHQLPRTGPVCAARQTWRTFR